MLADCGDLFGLVLGVCLTGFVGLGCLRAVSGWVVLLLCLCLIVLIVLI